MLSDTQIKTNLQSITTKLRQISCDAQVIAVTKTHPVESYHISEEAGLLHIGENKIQECRDKIPLHREQHPGSKLVYHYIGPLQSKKVKYLPGLIDSYDTLAELKIARALENKISEKEAAPIRVLLQVNSTDEPQKAGLNIGDLSAIKELAEFCLNSKNLVLEGLLTMGPTPDVVAGYYRGKTEYDTDTRRAFEKTAELLNKLRTFSGTSLPRLSMGMSSDFDIACQCDATEIRIGSELFGERVY